MATVNENINFDVNFNENELKSASKAADTLDKSVESILNDLKELSRQEGLSPKFRSTVVNAVKSIESLSTAMDNVNKAADAIEGVDLSKLSSTSGKGKLGYLKDYKDSLEALKGSLSGVRTALDGIGNVDQISYLDKQIEAVNAELKETIGLMDDVGKNTPLSTIDKSTLPTKDKIDVDQALREGGIDPSASNKNIAKANREAKLQEAMVRHMNNKVTAQRKLDDERKSAMAGLSSEANTLESELGSIESAYNSALSSGDFSSLRQANEQFRSLRDRAEALRDAINQASSQGVDTSALQSTLGSLESRMNSISRNVGSSLKKQLLTNFKGVISKMNQMANAALRGIFNVANKLTRSWLNVMNKSFSSIVSLWKRALSALFSSGNNKSSSLVSQLTSLVSTAALLALGKQAVDLSSKIFEIQNVVDNVFPQMTDTINEFCDSAINKFGLTGLEAKQFVGVFGGMLSASNIVGEAQAEMSKNLTALTGDLASFYNMATEDVYHKLQSGLAGNTQAMRTFGVSMTVANLEAFALSRGINTSYREMSQAEKTTLRYNYMLSQLSVAQGDFARTSMSWANQVRTLSSNFKQLLAILGGGIIKALYPALVVLNQIVVAAVNAANALAKLFGFEAADLSGMFGGGAAMPDFSEYSSGLEDVADATGDVADAAGSAAEETAKANENLQSFDKLNSLQSPSSSGGGGGGGVGGVGGGAGGLMEFDSYYDKIKDVDTQMNARLKAVVDTLKRFAKDIASVDYSAFVKSWKNLSSRIGVLVDDVGHGIVWLWDNVLFPFYQWSMEQSVPAVFDLFAEGLNALHEIIVAVSPEIDEFWRNTLAPYFSAKGDAFVKTIKNWTVSLRNWTTGLKNSTDKLGYLKDTVQNIKDNLYNWIDDEGITSRLDSIGEHLSGIFSNLISEETKAQAASLLGTFSQLSLIVFDNILGVVEFLTGNEAVTEFVGFVVDEFGELADYTFDKLKDIIQYIAESEDAKEIITNIKDAIKNIVDWVDDHKETIIALLEGASEVLSFISEHLTEILIALGAIKLIQAFVTVVNGASTFLTSLKDIKKVFKDLHDDKKDGSAGKFGSKVSKVFTSIKETAVTVFSKIKSLAVTAFNGIKTAASNMATKVKGSLSGLSAAAVPVAGSIAVAAGSAYLGKQAYDYTKSSQEMMDEFDASFTKTYDSVDKLVSKQKMLFDSTNFVDYRQSINSVTDAFGSLEKDVRNLVAKGGFGSGIFDAESFSSIQDEAKKYAEALREAGYANDELLVKLETLANADKDVISKEDRDELLMTMREITMGVAEEWSALSGKLTDEEAAKIDEFFNGLVTSSSEAGAEVVQEYSRSFTDNLSYVDTATGMMYDRLTNSYREATSASELYGHEAIVGYVDGMGAEKEFLVTETGNVIDSSTGVVMKMPEEWKKLAKDSLSGMALAFNEDGSVKLSAESLIKNVSAGAKTEANTGALGVKDEYLNTLSGGISSDTSTANAAVKLASDAINAAAEKMGIDGGKVPSELIRKVSSDFDNDTAVSDALVGNMSSAIDAANTEVINNSGAVGENTVDGIVNGINNRSGSLWDTIWGVGKSLLTTFTDSVEIKSPSKAFARIAQWIPPGIAKGIYDTEDEAYRSIEDISSGMLNTFGDSDFDLASLINTSKFSDKYQDILYETDIFTKALSSKYGNMSPLDMQSNMVISPSVKRNELAANLAQSSTTTKVAEGVSAMYSKLGASKTGGNGNIVCQLIMSGNKMAEFVIDTINGNAIQTGNF